MSLISDKKNIFTQIGAMNSLKEDLKLPDLTNLFPSVNNKKEAVPFLLDVLKTVGGTDSVQSMTGEMLVNMTNDIEPQLKDSLKKQMVDYNSGDPIPDGFQTEVSIADIDISGKLKTSPDSEEGSLLYNNDAPNFDSMARQAIQNAGTDTTFGNLTMNYNSTTDKMTLKPVTSSSDNIGNWFAGFIGGITLINKKEFTTNVLNAFYGTLSKKQKKSVEQLIKEIKVAKILNQIEDDDSFEVPDESLDEIIESAKQMAAGVMYYDLGCGLMEVSLPFSALTETVTETYNSTDPNFVAQKFAETIDISTQNVQEVAAVNKPTIKDNFFQRIIKTIEQAIVQAITSTPQIRTLLALKSAFQNNGITQISNPLDDMKNFKTMIKCMSNDAKKTINKFIFQLILTLLIALLKPIIIKITKEKINQYTNEIKSLTSSSL